MHPDIKARLPQWKGRYGEILYIPLAGQEFVLRLFTLGEYTTYRRQEQINEEEAKSILIQGCLLWPENFSVDTLDQSDFEALTTQLVKTSPFDNKDRLDQKITEARDDAKTVAGVIYTYLSAAFTSLTPADIDKLSPTEVFHWLGLAEQILQRPLPIGPKLNEDENKEAAPPPNQNEIRAMRAARHAQRVEERRRKMMTGSASIAPSLPGEEPEAPQPKPKQGYIDWEKEARQQKRFGIKNQ